MNNKLREALLKASIALSWASHHHLTEDDAKECLEVVDAALAEPLRNCDIGTADEQIKRQHDTMCNTTKACPDSDWSCRKCFAEWSQMPYEEQKEINK